MEEKNIIDGLEAALMDRITDSLAKNEDYLRSVEKEGETFEWLKNNLTGKALEKLNEYFNNISSTAFYMQKLSYLKGMKDLFAFYEYLGGKADREKS